LGLALVCPGILLHMVQLNGRRLNLLNTSLLPTNFVAMSHIPPSLQWSTCDIMTPAGGYLPLSLLEIFVVHNLHLPVILQHAFQFMWLSHRRVYCDSLDHVRSCKTDSSIASSSSCEVDFFMYLPKPKDSLSHCYTPPTNHVSPLPAQNAFEKILTNQRPVLP